MSLKVLVVRGFSAFQQRRISIDENSAKAAGSPEGPENADFDLLGARHELYFVVAAACASDSSSDLAGTLRKIAAALRRDGVLGLMLCRRFHRSPLSLTNLGEPGS